MSTPVFVPVDTVEITNVKNSWLVKPFLKDSDKLTGGSILPVKGEKNVLVTSVFRNINNIPHLGDIVSILSADVFTRYCRSRGLNTLYVSGVNEHDAETEMEALEANMTPQELCDKYFKTHKEIFEWLNISFNKFGRTTSLKQTNFVHKIFNDINVNGYTSIAVVEHLLCENCEVFSADYNVVETSPMSCVKDIKGIQHDIRHNGNATKSLKPRCNNCQNTIDVSNSQEMLLNLYKVETKLENWVNKFSDNWSSNAQVITKSWINKSLKRICITRALTWGISKRFGKLGLKVFYDWFALPISYISATAEYSQQWDQWWMPKDDTKITYFQFMDKNDVEIHSILFSELLFATERKYTLVNHINATECLKYEHGEFCKTHGMGIFGNDLQTTTLSSDIIRFYLMFIRPESQESSFDWLHLAITNNLHLVNNFEQFYDETLSKLKELFDSTIPEIQLDKDDHIFLALVTRYLKQYITMLDNGKLKDGLLQIISISRLCNEYISFQLLWSPSKNLFEFRAKTVIGLCCNLVCLLAILLKPYMPEAAIEIGKQMNIDFSNFVLKDYIGMILETGHRIGEHVPIFKSIDFKLAFKLKRNFTGKLTENKKKMDRNLNKNLFSPSGKDFLFASNNELEQAITEQSKIIKTLKQGNVEKAELKPYVDELLKMKRKLKMTAESNATTSNV